MDANNTTSSNATGNADTRALQAALIACQVVNVALLGLSLYLTACVAAYGWKIKSWKKNYASGMDRGIIYTICLVAMIADVPRLVLVEIVFNVKTMPGETNLCEVLVDVTMAFYYVAVYPKYVFLWYRQHTLNSHPASIRLFSAKRTETVSYCLLITLTTISVFVAYFYLTYSFMEGPVGCVFIPVENASSGALFGSAVARDYILASCFALIEFVLLFLFVLPLFQSYKLKRKLLNKPSKDTACPEDASNTEKKPKDRLTSLMQRSTMAAATVVLIDVVVLIIAVYTPPSRPVAILMVTYNIRNGIHAMCILSSFSIFKEILTIFCPKWMRRESRKEDEADIATVETKQF